MMITCVHCGKNIEDAVQKKTAEYQVGKVICPHCHKQNKRYLSEMDLHMMIMGNMLIYGIVLSLMCQLTLSFYDGKGNFWLAILITIVALVIVVIGISRWSVYVYDKAPMKREWANYTMKEDAASVNRSVKRNFFGFIILVIVLGLLSMYINFYYYVIGTLVYILLMYVKLKTIQKREKAYYESMKK